MISVEETLRELVNDRKHLYKLIWCLVKSAGGTVVVTSQMLEDVDDTRSIRLEVNPYDLTRTYKAL